MLIPKPHLHRFNTNESFLPVMFDGCDENPHKNLPYEIELQWLLCSFMKRAKMARTSVVNRGQCMLVALHVLTMALVADKNIN